MTDHELMANYLRYTETGDSIALEVALVVWPHPHRPELQWQPYQVWGQEPTNDEIKDAHDRLLADQEFFRVCTRCQRKLNRGQLHGFICHGCAERELGIVH